MMMIIIITITINSVFQPGDFSAGSITDKLFFNTITLDSGLEEGAKKHGGLEKQELMSDRGSCNKEGE